jgi:hypothetical protein
MSGVFVSNTADVEWVKLKGGIPTSVLVMDLDLQPEEDDLVVSTFGRGVYILDDYSPLRHLTTETLEEPAALFPVADALMFVEAEPFGYPGVGFQGASYYSAPNPEVGASITYYVKEDYKSLKELRNEAEKKLQDEGKDVELPDYDQRKKEATEEEPFLLFAISDSNGQAIRKIKQPIKAGVQRVVWDFRANPVGPISMKGAGEYVPWDSPDLGYMVPPGTYQVTMYRYQEGTLTQIGTTQDLTCNPINIASLPAADLESLDEFNRKVAKLARAISAADAHHGQLEKNLPYLEQAVLGVPLLEEHWLADLSDITTQLREVNEQLNGDRLLVMDEGQPRMSLKGRTDLIVAALWSTTSGVTGTFERAYREASEGFGAALAALQRADASVKQLEDELEAAGAPYTPGRMPVWE